MSLEVPLGEEVDGLDVGGVLLHHALVPDPKLLRLIHPVNRRQLLREGGRQVTKWLIGESMRIIYTTQVARTSGTSEPSRAEPVLLLKRLHCLANIMQQIL